MSSTAVAIRGLADRNEVDAPHGRLAVGVLLFQDVAIVGALVLVPVLGGQIAPREVPLLLGRAAAALLAVGVIGRLVLPPLVRAVLRARRREVFPFALLVASVGTAWLCARLGLPTAVGAFFGGLVLAESEFSHQAQAEIGPLRDLLASLFFVSLGLIVDLPAMVAYLWLLPLVVGAIILGKTLVATLGFAAIRQRVGVAVGAGLALAQVGEFSFILGREGLAAGLIDEATWQVLLASSIATMLLTPALLAAGPSLAAFIGRLARRPRAAMGADAPVRQGHVIVLGFGLGGRIIAAALRVAGRPYAVLDLNGKTVLEARAAGEPIAYGDAASPGALAAAGAGEAAAVAIVLNDPEASRRAVRAVRGLSAAVPIVVRARYRLEAERLLAIGATAVAVEEIETSLEVLGLLLARLPMSPGRVRRDPGGLAARGAGPGRKGASPRSGLTPPVRVPVRVVR